MRTLLIVTGSSRGLGRACAIAFATHPDILKPIKNNNNNDDDNPLLLEEEKENKRLDTILVARSRKDLKETLNILNESVNASTNSKCDICTETVVADLSNLETLDHTINTIFDSCRERGKGDDTLFYDRAILVNNAGSLGRLGPITGEANSLKELRSIVDFNMTSCFWFTTRFLQKFSTMTCERAKTLTECTIVNISSICAVKGFPTMGIYCAGKAARDMFHSVLAKEMSIGQAANINSKNDDNSESSPINQHENQNQSNVTILNYAPGPCETEMASELEESTFLDPDLSAFFRKAKKDGTLVKPKDTMEILADLVLKGTSKGKSYNSGDHVDYFDIVER